MDEEIIERNEEKLLKLKLLSERLDDDDKTPPPPPEEEEGSIIIVVFIRYKTNLTAFAFCSFLRLISQELSLPSYSSSIGSTSLASSPINDLNRL